MNITFPLILDGVNIFGARYGSGETFIAALKTALVGVSVKSPVPDLR